MSFPTLFFFKIDLAILGQLHFHVNLKIIRSISAKNLAGIFIGIVLNMYIDQFGGYCHLNNIVYQSTGCLSIYLDLNS